MSAELQVLRTEPVFKARENGERGQLSATGLFRDKQDSVVGSFSLQITGKLSAGIEPKLYIEVVRQVLDELEKQLK